MLFVGHRGGRGDGWPAENTMRAIERAKREGADGVEVDVRLARSGEIVVFHDEDLSRATGGADARRVDAVAWAELSRVRLFGGDETMPRLVEVLDHCAEQDLWLNVELKYDLAEPYGLAQRVAMAVRNHRWPLVVSSFDPRLLWAARACGLTAPTALLTDTKQRYATALVRVLGRRPVFDGVHFNVRQATSDRVRRARARGLFVGAWTVNRAAEARELRAMGASWVISDEAGALKRAQ